MGYLSDNPVFRHLFLLERNDALWLLPENGSRWTLPGFVSHEQHTAELELVARRMRARHAARISVLGDVAAVAVAAGYRRQPSAVVAAHPWMREMPPFCLRRIIARRAWGETPP